MFQKLEEVEKRYEEVTKKISDPEVISKQEEWKALMKEHAEIEPVVLKYREYRKANVEGLVEKKQLYLQELYLECTLCMQKKNVGN